MSTCCRCKTTDLEAFHPSQQTRAYAWCRACYRDWYVERSGGMVVDECMWCGSEYAATARASQRRMFCSRSCKDRATNALRQMAIDEARPARSCPHCGKDISPGMRSDARFCSNACMEAAHNATRKAKWKTGRPAEYVSRAEIIARDGGRCHMCRKRCQPDDLHLDHLIPLSAGGDHTAANLAVACARCNLKRGAGRIPAQLRLVG